MLPFSMEREYLIPFTEYEIKRKEIAGFFTDACMAQIGIWQQYKLFGWPFAPLGWAEHPAVLVDIIQALEMENNKRGNK